MYCVPCSWVLVEVAPEPGIWEHAAHLLPEEKEEWGEYLLVVRQGLLKFDWKCLDWQSLDS
jgi:hypothetical protein